MSTLKKRHSYKCVERSCKLMKDSAETISFFSFLKDPARRAIWLENCQLTDANLCLDKIKLCGKHFQKILSLNDLENRLHPHAIPTLFPDRIDDVTTVSSTGPLVGYEKIEKSSETIYNEVLALPLPVSPGKLI